MCPKCYFGDTKHEPATPNEIIFNNFESCKACFPLARGLRVQFCHQCVDRRRDPVTIRYAARTQSSFHRHSFVKEKSLLPLTLRSIKVPESTRVVVFFSETPHDRRCEAKHTTIANSQACQLQRTWDRC